MTAALTDVQAERVRQTEKWGVQDRCPSAWITICAEELGEAAKVALTLDLLPFTPAHMIHYRMEMVQLAACAVAAVEALDRGEWKPGNLKHGNADKPENT